MSLPPPQQYLVATYVNEACSGRAAASRRAACGACGARERSVAASDRPRAERLLPPGDVPGGPLEAPERPREGGSRPCSSQTGISARVAALWPTGSLALARGGVCERVVCVALSSMLCTLQREYRSCSGYQHEFQ